MRGLAVTQWGADTTVFSGNVHSQITAWLTWVLPTGERSRVFWWRKLHAFLYTHNAFAARMHMAQYLPCPSVCLLQPLIFAVAIARAGFRGGEQGSRRSPGLKPTTFGPGYCMGLSSVMFLPCALVCACHSRWQWYFRQVCAWPTITGALIICAKEIRVRGWSRLSRRRVGH